MLRHSEIPVSETPKGKDSEPPSDFLTHAIQRLQSLLRDFAARICFGGASDYGEPLGKVLPSDVRFALDHRQSQLGSAETADLVRNGFEREALYLLLKIEAAKPERQLMLFQELAAAISNKLSDTGEGFDLRSFVESHLAGMQGDPVNGAKLKQLSVQGFEHRYQLYETESKRSADDSREMFLVASTPFIGLVEFMRAFTAKRRALQIISPSFIEDPDNCVCGYRIAGGHAEFLDKSFTRPARAVLFDYTRNPASPNIANVINFWRHRESIPEPELKFFDSQQELYGF